MIKSYVIDTNILIQAPYACQCFEENRVILPLVVLEELDMERQEKINEDMAYALSYLSIYNCRKAFRKISRIIGS